MKKIIYLFIVVLFSCTNQTVENDIFTELIGDYLGQELPGDSSLLFAANIVSTGIDDRDIAIYPDGSEIYFCRNILDFKYATILFVKKVNGYWTKPQIAKFAEDPNYIYIEPHISPDGSKFYFASNKQAKGKEPGSMEIWVSERNGDFWGEPYNIGEPINTGSDQYFPSVTIDGTMYFTSEDSTTNEEFIYRSKLVNGTYQKPELLPKNINMARARFNAYVSPNEDYIIVPAFGMPDSYGATDYYIVFRNADDIWSEPINMGDKVNSTNGKEWSASLSPDGKYIFFMSGKIGPKEIPARYTTDLFHNLNNIPQNGSSDIYWVKTDFIEELRKQAKF